MNYQDIIDLKIQLKNHIKEFGEILSEGYKSFLINKPDNSDNSIKYLVDLRTRLRKRSHFKFADMVKKHLLEKNILLFDSKNGTNWEYKYIFEERKRDESAGKRFEAWFESTIKKRKA